MFCDLGGVLGLYVGFSLFTIFEFFEFFGSLVWICVVRLYRRPLQSAAVVGVDGDSTSEGGNAAAANKMQTTPLQSPHPPAYDGLTGKNQFQLFTDAKNLPVVNC